ncbi:hypothetical protein H0H87_005960 [Tephrocybe sp. NHM501043]|nr:hypothetical protein H0H87_005960 [Tephrocybe sp. NHM501043]
MAPSPSGSTPRTSVRPPSTYKTNETAPPEQSYFSIPTYSTIPVSTPLAVSSASVPVTSISQRSIHSEPTESHEMLDRFATRFPPPPSLSLPPRRQQAPDPFAPHIVTCHRSTSLQAEALSPADRAGRSPAPAFPSMVVMSSPARHTFRVQLPHTIESEMITISANRGDKLKIIADAWNLQNDCHYEWQINFAPRDIDLTAVQAKFEPNGYLTVDVQRIAGLTVSF